MAVDTVLLWREQPFSSRNLVDHELPGAHCQTAKGRRAAIAAAAVCKWLPLFVSFGTIIIFHHLLVSSHRPVDVHSSNRCLIGVGRKLTAATVSFATLNRPICPYSGSCHSYRHLYLPFSLSLFSPGNRLAAFPIASLSTHTQTQVDYCFCCFCCLVAAVWLLLFGCCLPSPATCYLAEVVPSKW